MFASSIPEIIELVGSGSKYGGELKREHGKRLELTNIRTNQIKIWNNIIKNVLCNVEGVWIGWSFITYLKKISNCI